MQNLAALAHSTIKNFANLDSTPKNYRPGMRKFFISDDGVRDIFIQKLLAAKVSMTDEQENSIRVKNGIITSPMMGMFKSWVGLPPTNFMTDQFEKALENEIVKAGIAANWRELQKRKAQAAAAKDDEPEAAPKGAQVKREAPEPEKPKPATPVAAVKPPPAKIKTIVAAKDDDNDDDATPVTRTKSVTLASAALVPPRPTETPPVQPALTDAAAAPATVPATQAEPQAPSPLLPVPATQAVPAATPEASTAPILAVPREVLSAPAPSAPATATAAQGVVTPNASVVAANADAVPPKASTPKVAAPPETYGPSLKPIQDELIAINKLIKAHRAGAGAEKAEMFLYGKVENGHLSSKDLVELANKMQNATTDPKMRETVAQLGKDLGQMTPRNAKGSASDVAGKLALKDTVVTQRS